MIIAPYRMMITGSQTWTDFQVIEHTIGTMAMEAAQLGRDLLVVHGHCPRGADSIAHAVVVGRRHQGWRIDEERHPAQWGAPCTDACRHGARRVRRDGSDFCQSAGMHRNLEMVKLGCDAFFAFHRGGSSGTANAIRHARAAGIVPTVITWEERHRYV